MILANDRGMRTSKGFSLVELMIVVAIIGILAAIAIPNFMAMQLKAKRSELPTNVNGIKTAEIAYNVMYDRFVGAAENGAIPHDKTAKPWTNGLAGWKDIPFTPDGLLRGSYAIDDLGEDFLIRAGCDVDGDGVDATFTASKDVGPTQTSANDVF